MAQRQATIFIDVPTNEARQSVRNLGTELQRLEGWSEEARNSVQRLAAAGNGMSSVERHARSSGQQIERLAQQSNRAVGQTNRYNQVLYSAGDALQDFQYSGAAAANNLAQMAEMVASTRGSFRDLVGSVLGMGGAVFALQALMAYGPELQQFFFGGAKSIEEFTKRVDEATDSLITIQSEVNELRAELSVEQARGFVAGLKEDEERLERMAENLKVLRSQAGETKKTTGGLLFEQDLEDLQAVVGDSTNIRELLDERRVGFGGTGYAIREENAQALLSILREQGITQEEINKDIAATSSLLKDEEEELENIEARQRGVNLAKEQGVEFTKGEKKETENLTDLNRQLEEQRLRMAGATEEAILQRRIESIQKQREAKEEGTEAYKELLLEEKEARLELSRLHKTLAEEEQQKAIEAFKQQFQRQAALQAAYRAQQRAFRAEQEADAERERELLETQPFDKPAAPGGTGGGAFDEAMGQLGGILRLYRAGRRTQAEAAAESVDVLSKALDDLAKAGKKGSEEWQILNGLLTDAEANMEATADATMTATQIVGTLGSAAFNALGQAIRQAETATEGLLLTLSAVVQAAGQLMVQVGLQSGNVPLAIAGMGVSLFGGLFEGRAHGGPIRGPGGPRDDRIPIMASDGEFVVNAESAGNAQRLLRAMNADPNLAGTIEEQLSGATPTGSAYRERPMRPAIAPELMERFSYHVNGGAQRGGFDDGRIVSALEDVGRRVDRVADRVDDIDVRLDRRQAYRELEKERQDLERTNNA